MKLFIDFRAKVIHRFENEKSIKSDLYTDLYTLSTGFCLEKAEFFMQKQERMFCEVLPKFAFNDKISIFLLTNPMSKIYKKQLELLQNKWEYVILFIQ